MLVGQWLIRWIIHRYFFGQSECVSIRLATSSLFSYKSIWVNQIAWNMYHVLVTTHTFLNVNIKMEWNSTDTVKEQNLYMLNKSAFPLRCCIFWFSQKCILVFYGAAWILWLNRQLNFFFASIKLCIFSTIKISISDHPHKFGFARKIGQKIVRFGKKSS